jgi:hypothetical protein
MNRAVHLAACLAFVLQAANGGEFESEARSLFIRVEQIYRLPKDAQRETLQELYSKVYPALTRLLLYGEAIGPRPPFFDQCSPEELLVRLGTNPHVWHWIALSSCQKILKENEAALATIVRKDLVARTNLSNALRTARDFRLHSLIYEVVDVFEASDELADLAANTLGSLGGDVPQPRAIQALLTKDPKNPTKYFQELGDLSFNRPANPELIKVLHSDDPTHRWQATQALARSTGELAFSQLEFLVRDSEPEVRKWAGTLALHLSQKGMIGAREYAVYLLDDADRIVRRHVAFEFGYRNDPMAIIPFFRLLQDGQEENPLDILNPLYNQTDSYFDYDGKKLGKDQDMTILDGLAHWIKKHHPLETAAERGKNDRLLKK